MNANILKSILESMNMEVTVNETNKGNVKLTGFTIGTGTIRPIVYMEHYEEAFRNGGYLAVVNAMLDDIKKAEPVKINTDEIATWEYAQKHLRLCISPVGTNPGCVVYPYLDLELYVRVVADETENGNASYKVKTEMLKKWNVSGKQLLHETMLRTIPLYEAKSMGEVMYEITGCRDFLEEENPMIVGKTKDGLNGASIIYHKPLLKNIADRFDDDLIIMPSSIHECILKPVGEMNIDDISALVADINANEVSPEEVLSDHAYIFHRDTMEITW